MRARSGAIGALGGVLAASASVLAALPHGPVASAPGLAVVAEGGAERWTIDLGGLLLSVLSPETTPDASGLWLLVRPPREPDGPRRLLRLQLEPEPRLDLVAAELNGGLDTLRAVGQASGAEGGGNLELVATGSGGAHSLGQLDDLTARALSGEATPLAAKALLDPAGFRAAAPARGLLVRGVEGSLAALQPGRLRFWNPSDGWGPEVALPLTVTRTAKGLRLESPPVAKMGDGPEARYLAGPEPFGSARLRGFEVEAVQLEGAHAPPAELWAALPGPESVEQSWAFEIDGRPVLVVRTQAADELNLFERQRLRVLALDSDRTRAGSLPTLATELDSKRWHETSIALGDVDRDGRQDLLAAFPEGLSGSDLVAEWWRGEGSGRFESRTHRSDLDRAGERFVLVGGPEPGILVVVANRLELRSFETTGKSAVSGRPKLEASIPLPPLPSANPPQSPVAVANDAAGAKAERSSGEEIVDPEADPLGVVEIDGRPGVELLAVQSLGPRGERLILVRSRAD